jgi:mono/diheme cytochrome c family protein
MVAGFLTAQTIPSGKISELQTGRDIFMAACVTCHGPDGRGNTRTALGFETRLPDFTDCGFATKEPDGDWSATIHNGGQARGLSRIMPSFRDALSDDQIDKVIEHLRGFCKEKHWPAGDLNLPRPFMTEKAFPESETVTTTTVNATGTPGVHNVVYYEHRVGARDQFEAAIPHQFVHDSDAGRGWMSGFSDISLGWKRVVFSTMKGGGTLISGMQEMYVPVGDVQKGTGIGTTLFESHLLAAQILPKDFFVHFDGGFEIPVHTDKAPKAYFLRTALGWSWSSKQGYGRTWSPMMEFVADKDLIDGVKTNYTVVPQLQIPLSRKMHIMAGIGVAVPVNNMANRQIQPMFYFLWDWADGGLKQGW